MFHTKKDVDKHCQEVFRNIKSERERNLRCLSIAQQYYNVRDYESAKRYVILYLSVKDDSSIGHKLLAQCYDCLQDKEKALNEYKYSLQLDSKQPGLILRVCELLAENCVTVDKTQAKYWLEKAEIHFPYHPSVSKLKQKIAVLNDKMGADTVESIILDEIKARSNDPSVHSKLLSFLIENGRTQEAYNKAFSKIPHFTPTLQWYQSCVQICKTYKTQFPNAIGEDFYGNYLFALERTLALSVQDVKIFRKSIPECITFLAKFDEALSASVLLTNKSDNFLVLINHMAGQLCYHKANILYRKVKWDENSIQDVNQFITPLLLLSTSDSFTIVNYKKHDTSVTRVLDQCSRCNAYRVSQAGLVLLSRCKDSPQKQFLENILQFCKANWRERILEKVYSISDFKNLCKSSFFANYAAFSNLPMDLPKGLTDNVEQFVSVTEATQPASLHHLVWLGVQYLINSNKQSICDRLISLKFRSTSFASLQFAPSTNIASSYAETLSKIDVDAFLYACVYCAESTLHQPTEASKLSAFKILPADVSKLLCSPEHELWWESAYQIANQTIPEDSLSRVRAVVQRGIEVVRLMGNNDLPLSLLVLLGRTFVNRAAIEPNENLASALETRALLYWKAAAPLLNRIIRDEAHSHSVKSMFDYFGQPISKSDAIKLLNESKRFHDMQQLKGNNYVDDFFSNESTSKFNLNLSSVQSFSGESQSTNNVDEKMLCTLMEQNAKIMDRLDTLFNKHELLSTNQLQLYEMVSVLAKKIDVFVIDSLSQAVQPLSPQNPVHSTAANLSQLDVPVFNSLTPTPHFGVYPFASSSHIQTNFPMYQPPIQPITSVAPPYVPSSFLPHIPASSFSQSSIVPPLPTSRMFDPLDNYTTCEISKTVAASVTPSLSIGSPLSSTSLYPNLFSTSGEALTSPAKSSLLPSQTSTPTTNINDTPNHSYHIKVPDLSSVVKSPSVQIPEESVDSDEEKRVVEHDPLPDFKPIIPLPDEITVTTGEEDEEILFESRAKLYRWVDKEWKERGIGMFKVLKNRDSKRVRILMRREIVHKVCANHFLASNMTLTPMFNSDRAWVYCAPDFASEEMVIEKLCVKFKSPEIAVEFKQIFDKYKTCNESTASPMKSKPVTPASLTPVASPLSGQSPVQTSVASSVSKKIIVAPPSLSIDNIEKINVDTKPKVSAESSPVNNTQTVADSKLKFGGFTFNSSPIVTQPEGEKIKTEEKTKSTPFSSFSFSGNADLLKPTSGGSLFGTNVVVSSASEAPKQNAVTDPTLPFACVRNTIDFSSLSKNLDGATAFAKSDNFKGFAGAGSLVFGSASPSSKVASTSSVVSAILKNIDGTDKVTTTSSEANSKEMNDSRAADDEFVPTVEFTPVVPLPDLIEVKTGEENLELLYEEQCKLFRFVKDEWKERGVGKMKIFRDPTDGSVRMLMRRDQVHKVCCNQRISAELELKPIKTNNKAWMWSNHDFSEGELEKELFCVRFKTTEQAETFKEALKNAQELLLESKEYIPSATCTSEKKSMPALTELFKRDPNTWECQVCYVVNKNEANSCSACTTPKEGAPSTTSATSGFGSGSSSTTTNTFGAPKSEFKFGVPAATSLFSFGNSEPLKVTSTPTMSFSFGPSSTTAPSVDAPKHSFGNLTFSSEPSQCGSNTSLFSFGNNSAKPMFGGSIFGDVTANEGTKPKENISIFSGSPIKTAEPSSAFSSFSFKFGPKQPPDSTVSSGSPSSVKSSSKQHTTLYRQVPLLIRDENDKLLFESPAKLYRYVSGEWEARGVGRILVSRNIRLDKCRLLMFREPLGVVACLNHYLQDEVTFFAYDQCSWIWSAADFAEGEIVSEKFCLVFENDRNAKAFRTTLENVTDSKDLNEGSSSTDEVEFVSETQISEEDKKLAEKLKLPTNYFAYKYSNRSCPGCEGCEPEDGKKDEQNEPLENSPKTTVTSTNSAATKSDNKRGFVFGATADPSWCKGSFNFSNIFNNSNTKDTASTSNTSVSEVVENAGSEEEEVVTNDNDPYFEPIVPLPDVVETKTGEEDEETLFQERAKIFRFDEDRKEWKERGIGDLKILHNPSQGSYRLLLRREQVHKVVLNQRLTSSFAVQPLLSSKNSLCWFGMNFSEESGTSVLEKLAARFKTEEIMSKFEEVVSNCVSELSSSQANQIVGDSQVNESYSAEHEIIEGERADENEYAYDADDSNVAEYGDGQRDYIDEQGIEDAMQDVNDYYEGENEDSLFESQATLQVHEGDISVTYAGLVKIFVGFYEGDDDPTSVVEFSTADVPALYTAAITKETFVVHEGTNITIPMPSDSEPDSKAIICFENEELAEKFVNIFEQMKSYAAGITFEENA